MLNENIDKMIMEAMKEKDSIASTTYRMIKNEFLKYKTAKNAKPLDEATEISILQKMVKQREESIEDFKKANRQDLIVQELAQIRIIEKFLPAAPTKDDIMVYLDYWYPNGIEKKDMGKVIKELKDWRPGVDGKMASEIVRENLCQ